MMVTGGGPRSVAPPVLHSSCHGLLFLAGSVASLALLPSRRSLFATWPPVSVSLSISGGCHFIAWVWSSYVLFLVWWRACARILQSVDGGGSVCEE